MSLFTVKILNEFCGKFYSTAQEVTNQMFYKQNVMLVRQESSHIMEHLVKPVLLEATVLEQQRNVLSVLLDTSKYDYDYSHLTTKICRLFFFRNSVSNICFC